jgi:hypothetical protein
LPHDPPELASKLGERRTASRESALFASARTVREHLDEALARVAASASVLLFAGRPWQRNGMPKNKRGDIVRLPETQKA